MPQICPHCGKLMTQGVITENYEMFYVCDCEGSKAEAQTQKRTPRKNPANPKKTLKEAERYLLDMTRETHDRFIALALVEEKYGTDIALEVGKKYRIGRERAIHHGTDLDTLIHIADERGFKTLCGLDVHGVGVGFKKEDITCTKCLLKSNPKRAKKNPLAGTDVWGHKLFIENPTPEELQAIADTLGVPVGIQKDITKEIDMYKRFHRRKPDEIIKVNHPGTPKSLVALGKLKSVIYHKCTDGEDYIHDLKHGLLCSDKTGKLWIIGDKARITKRGIVG